MSQTSLFSIFVSSGTHISFTYHSSCSLKTRQLVIVPFRNQEKVGLVEAENNEYSKTTKEVINELKWTLSTSFVSFLKNVSSYNMIPFGKVLKMAVPLKVAELLKEDKISFQSFQFSLPTLNEEQEKAYQSLYQARFSYGVHVLDGVTGSGKTEVYFKCIKSFLEEGKKVLVLLPEIALTQAICERFNKAFGNLPSLWHSGITPAQKRLIWKKCQEPGPMVILGARSALFLPIVDLSFIIVDEEHDSSYKQEELACYHARDMAVWRAKEENIPILLSSATPSLETMVNIEKKRYYHIPLTVRFQEASFPKVTLIDKKQYPKAILTPPLVKAIEERLHKKEQTLLFFNRRGFAPLMLCQSCDYRWKCPSCQIELTWHKEKNQMICHYCGFYQHTPHECPECKSEDIKDFGLGVEKVENVILEKFPSARTLIMSSDTLTSPKRMAEAFEKIHNDEIDIIVGTQVLAKGHHFPNLTLVGILNADLGLHHVDLRASEKAYQLLHQVGGRAGRMAYKPGEVYIQTLEPDHALFQALINHKRDDFFKIEQEERELCHMPPFARMALLTFSALNEMELKQFLKKFSSFMPAHPTIEVLGPAPSPLYKLRSRYRMRFLIKGNRNDSLQSYIDAWLLKCVVPSSFRCHIDIDPLSFL